MKTKITSLIATLIVLVIAMTPFSVFATETITPNFETNTESLLLADTSNDNVLFSQDSNVVRTMASTTKIMTYIIAAEEISDLENTMIEIKEEPIDAISGKGASVAGFQNHIGESYSALDILYGLMIPSGCDAAEILALYLGNGNESDFVDKMNEKATDLGCENTHYADAHGLSSENKTTASDLYKIAKYALDEPYFRTIVKTEYYTLPGETNPMINSNYLVDEFNGGLYYYQYTIGIKTGYTSAAGKCLVSLAKKGDTEYLAVALGGKYSADDNYKNHAMLDSINLFKWAFDNFTSNIDIAFDSKYKSVNSGIEIPLKTSITRNDTNEDAKISWSTSDSTVANVDKNGNVYALSPGKAIIKAETQTGNFALCKISVGFYNGIDVNSNYGDYSSGTKEPINWQKIKDYGYDFAIIRAGWGFGTDSAFKENIEGAYNSDLPYAISFTGYADDADEATKEAEYLISIIDDNILEYKDKISLPISYNLSDSKYRSYSKEKNFEIAKAFNDVMGENGFSTMIYANKSAFAAMDTDKLTENSINLYYSYCPYEVDFSDFPYINGSYDSVANAWLYRGDAYVPGASDQNNKTRECLVYIWGTKLILPSTDLKAVSVETEDGKIKYFADFDEAVRYADGKTAKITLNKDQSLPYYISLNNVNNNFEIDLGENTLTLGDNDNYSGLYMFAGNYKIKATTGGIKASGQALSIWNSDDTSVEIDGGFYSGDYLTLLLANQEMYETNATLVVNGGTFYGTENSTSICVDGKYDLGYILGENCKYRNADTGEWISDADFLSSTESYENISVSKIPISKVNLTAKDNTISSSVIDFNENEVNDGVSYKWFKYDKENKTTTEIEKENDKNLSITESGYYILEATKDQYTVKSKPIYIEYKSNINNDETEKSKTKSKISPETGNENALTVFIILSATSTFVIFLSKRKKITK